MTTPAPRKPAPRAGIVDRFTAKAGPLPVWAWAVLILVAGYLVYRLTSSGSSSTPAATPDSSSPDTTAGDVTGNDTGSPPASGQGGAPDNLNDSILSQLNGLSGQVDALTGLVQSTPAFWPGSGDSGSGSLVVNDGGPNDPVPPPASTAPPKATTPKVKAPAAAPHAPAHVHYYTFAPGKAPKNQKANEAPAKGPAGTKLHFLKGHGYFYA